MKKVHTSAMGFASCHFMLCGMVGAFVLFVSFGYALSDAYDEAVWWLVGLDKLLLFLEAPVALVLRLIYHPSARFQPPRLFTIDYMDSSRIIVVVGLCVLWSIIFGYLVTYAIQYLKNQKSNAQQVEANRH